MPASVSPDGTVCPQGEVLQAFSIGKLAAEPWQQVADHVERCHGCQDRLEGYDAASDGLITQLKHLDANVSAATPVVQIVADAGRDLARRLAEGPVRLDRFSLQAELGVGSFGYVFKAWDPRLERIVALKV